MRKNLIAMSAVAALGTFGLVGGAAAQMAVNTGGTGHQLVFPYFTTNGDNATSIAIVNTDTTNGKAVKVRFRGARNSDDVLDFQVLMSPGDVWTANVTQDASTGLSKLATTDASCTIPDSVRTAGATFVTARLDPQKDLAPQTREGYIEIINMGDIVKPAATYTTANLFYTVKHRSGVADCNQTIISAYLSSALSAAQSNTTGTLQGGLIAPTGGLAGDYIIVQQTNKAAWSGSATALVSGTDGTDAKVTYWPQNATAITAGSAIGPTGTLTSDPIMQTNANTSLNMVTLRNYDLPDLSTPYSSTASTSGRQLAELLAALRTTSTSNQFETSPSIGGLTDIVFTQPGRRYQVAVNYRATGLSSTSSTAVTGTVAAAVFTGSGNNVTAGALEAGGSNGFTANPLVSQSDGANGNTILQDRTLCLNSASLAYLTDREEQVSASGFVVSPGDPTVFLLCGEVAVTSINAPLSVSSALNASLTRQSVTTAYNNGWLQISTTNYGGYYLSGGNPAYSAGFAAAGTRTGLPFIGAAFVRASNASQNYGFTFGNKTKTN